jgi:catechol 2,3-dioxygenase-like lactoylglutathione lyase family enzyme
MAKIRHIAFIVKEPQKLYDYYHHIFDVEEVRRSDTGAIHVIDGFFNLAFLQQVQTEAEVVNTHRADGAEVNQRQGINHYGFTVDKLDDVLSRLDDSIKFGESPQNGRPAELRVIDPWGNNFDLSSRGFLGREEKKLPGVRHMVVQVDRPDKAAEFYTSALGLEELRRDTEGSILLGDGDITMGLIDEPFIGRPGIQYFGLQVEDWSAVQKRFKEVGSDLPDLRPGQTEARMRDPEGNLFVVSEQGWGA